MVTNFSVISVRQKTLKPLKHNRNAVQFVSLQGVGPVGGGPIDKSAKRKRHPWKCKSPKIKRVPIFGKFFLAVLCCILVFSVSCACAINSNNSLSAAAARHDDASSKGGANRRCSTTKQLDRNNEHEFLSRRFSEVF
jgi:hypothetical protein